MKKLMIVVMLTLFLAGMLPTAQPVQAFADSCEDLVNNIVVNSSHSLWDYLHCVGDSLSIAWELFYEYY